MVDDQQRFSGLKFNPFLYSRSMVYMVGQMDGQYDSLIGDTGNHPTITLGVVLP